MAMRRAVPVVGIFVLLVACGSASSDSIASGASSPETSTSEVALTTTSFAADRATTTKPAGPTTTKPVGTSTTKPLATTTTRHEVTAPGPPQTPLSGPLTTPPTARATDDYLPAGVPDQVFPPGTAAYQLPKGEAPTTATWSAGGVPAVLTDLYVSAGEACLSHWLPAKTAFQRVVTSKLCEADPANPGLLPPWSSSFPSVAACQDERLRVYRWTEKLLKAYDADPAFVPNFPTPPKA
jgi:hypothetical protein